MAILNDIRGIFTRRKPAQLDMRDDNVDVVVEAKPNATIEAVPGRPARGVLAGAPSNTIDDVMALARRISEHLEQQTARTDRLVECMQRLPDALDALPEINRQNARLLEVINEYLEHARRRDDTLNETLNGLSTASHRQTDVLGLLQQQMDASTQTSETLVSSLSDFREALGELAGSNARSSEVLARISRYNEEREVVLTTMLQRTQWWMVAAVVCCGIMSVAAMTLAGIAILG